MKLEYSVVLIICFGLASVLLWYFLNIIPIELAKEYSILFFLVLTIGFITYLIHGKGILTSPKKRIPEFVSIGYRNGIAYQRKKFRMDKTLERKSKVKNQKEKNPLLYKKKRSSTYNRKKYRH